MSKKFWIGFVVVLILIVGLDAIVNMVLLMGLYEETKDLWRPEGEMKFYLMYIIYVVIALFFTLIWDWGRKGKGVIEGFRYGVYIGIFMALPMGYGTYSMMPIPYALAFQWFIYGLIEYTVCGIALGLIYGKESPAPASS